MVTKITSSVKIDDKIKLLSTLFYINIVIGKGIKLSFNELNVLSLFVYDTDKQIVIEKSVENNYVKSIQSGENTISRLVKLNLLSKTKTNKRVINKNIIQGDINDTLLFNIILHNVNANK